jgi:hypothetical protein
MFSGCWIKEKEVWGIPGMRRGPEKDEMCSRNGMENSTAKFKQCSVRERVKHMTGR